MSIPPDEMVYQQDLSSPMDVSQYSSQSADFPTLLGHDSSHQVAHTGGMVSDYHVNHMQETGVRFHIPQYSVGDGMSMLHVAAHQQLASPVDSMISPTTTRHSVPSIYVNDNPCSQYDDMDVDRSPKKSKTYPPASPTVSQATASCSNYVEGEHRCPECQKVKKRECDLRKHMKRHTRPYGCTFAKCNKRFGSRNDWKRHENSQHFLDEMWRCALASTRAKDSPCGYLTQVQTQFANHLDKVHSIPSGTDESKSTCRNMHLGREGHHHFWCGFCNKLIQQSEGIQPGAWDVRFKHIGDHFDKDNMSIDDWVDIEKNRKKRLIANENQNKKANAASQVNDDSDLGEDGIPAIPAPGPYGRARKIVNEEADADGVSDDDWPLVR